MLRHILIKITSRSEDNDRYSWSLQEWREDQNKTKKKKVKEEEKRKINQRQHC